MCMLVYCNPPALGRDLAYIIITCPLSSIYVQSLMSATGYTLSSFTTGFMWPVWSTPHGLLSGWSSCQDPTFTVRLVILPGLHAQWHTIKDTGPKQEVGITWASLDGTPPCGTWFGKMGCHSGVTGRMGVVHRIGKCI